MQTKSLTTGDHQKIYYDHYQNGHAHLVVIAHGFFNSKGAVLLKKLTEALADQYDVVVLDFRGHGQSSGLFYWTAKEYVDLIAVFNATRESYKKIGLIGFSLGAAVSIVAAAKTDCFDSLIAVSAPIEFGKIDFHFWKLDFENDILYNLFGDGRVGKGVRPGPFWLKKDRPIDCVPVVKAPILFLHGTADWLIHHRHSQALYDKARCKKRLALIPNGLHAEYLIRKNKDETLRAIKDWFKETLNERGKKNRDF